MKQFNFIFFLLFSMPSLAYSAIQPIGPINFGKGVNYQTNPTEIDDAQSPDSCNCITNLDGSLSKRYGSERYIALPRSTQPIVSQYRAYASTGSVSRMVHIAITGNEIVYSTGDINPVWILMSSTIHANQKWSFTTMNNNVIMTGDGLIDPIFNFNIFTSSFTNLFSVNPSSESVIVRAKYLVQKSNYLLFLNCADVTNGTTYYPSRTYFSLLNQPSSTTYNRYFDVRTNDGEEITGGGVLNNNVDIFKPSSIHELSFTNLDLFSRGGDQQLSELVSNFGLKAPGMLQNNGLYYVLGSQDAIRFWDGGRRFHTNFQDEAEIISKDIKTLIDRLIKAKTYDKMICKYYKKRQWLIFSYNDPVKFPKNKNNSVIVYDIINKGWYPLCGILADSFETDDISPGDGTLFYGDSMDSYVWKTDLEIKSDDDRKEISIDNMDNQVSWTGATQNIVNVKEGTASLKIFTTASTLESSMTFIGVLNFGEWYNKNKISKDDKLSFKIYPSTIANITSLRVDIEVNDISGAFDTNFTSVTLSSSAFINGSTSWSTIEIALSSFPIRPDWTNFSTESAPFANTLTYYGLRFVLNSVNISSVSIDDVRIVGNGDSPVKFYRFTKLYNFGSMAFKNMGQILLTYEKDPSSNILMDIYNDFGSKVRSDEFESDIPKEIIVIGLVSTASISILNSSDFSVKKSTIMVPTNFLPFNGVANKKYIFFGDRSNDRLVKMDRINFGLILSSFGSTGSGTTNFLIIHQLDLDDDKIYLVDINNQRIKKHLQSDLSFITQVGSLGTDTTSYHQPTGIAVDDSRVVVADEGNYRLKDLDKSTFAYVNNTLIDYNEIGDSSLDMDENYKYLAYNKINDTNLNFQDVILEKRDKNDNTIINRINVIPNGTISLSTYTIMGDIALSGRYIYVSFTDDGNFGSNSNYYLQKRLKSDFSLVKEYKQKGIFYSVIGDAQAYKPITRNSKKDLKTIGKYFQIKYYDEGNDNNVKLYNQTFLLEAQDQTY